MGLRPTGLSGAPLFAPAPARRFALAPGLLRTPPIPCAEMRAGYTAFPFLPAATGLWSQRQREARCGFGVSRRSVPIAGTKGRNAGDGRDGAEIRYKAPL
jgi:hypothetical protein